MPRPRPLSARSGSSDESTIQFPSIDEKESRRSSASSSAYDDWDRIPFPSYMYPSAPCISTKYPICPRNKLCLSEELPVTPYAQRCFAKFPPRMGYEFHLGDFKIKKKAWYGYYFDPYVLETYAMRFIPDEFLYLWKDSGLWLLAVEMLGEQAGLNTDTQAEIVVVDGDAQREVPVRTRGAVMEPVGETCMIIPLCENTQFSMKRRPTQKQVDYMTGVLGQEPRWWEATDYVYRPKQPDDD